MKRFTIRYASEEYEQEHERDFGTLTYGGFDTIDEVIAYVTERGIPNYLISVTEWDLDNVDGFGEYDIIEQVCLEECHDGQESLA